MSLNPAVVKRSPTDDASAPLAGSIDTNWLRRWPNPANMSQQSSRCELDGHRVYIPETVEDD